MIIEMANMKGYFIDELDRIKEEELEEITMNKVLAEDGTNREDKMYFCTGYKEKM